MQDLGDTTREKSIVKMILHQKQQTNVPVFTLLLYHFRRRADHGGGNPLDVDCGGKQARHPRQHRSRYLLVSPGNTVNHAN